MLSIEEQIKLKRILEMISEDNQKVVPNHPSVSERLRDEKGRFLPNESPSRNKEEYPSRSIKVVKVKGTYGTYVVKEKVLDESFFHTLLTLGTVVFLSMIL